MWSNQISFLKNYKFGIEIVQMHSLHIIRIILDQTRTIDGDTDYF